MAGLVPATPCTQLQVLHRDGRHRAGHDGWSLCVRCADSLTSTAHRRAKHDIWYFGERRGDTPCSFRRTKQTIPSRLPSRHGPGSTHTTNRTRSAVSGKEPREGKGRGFPENESMWSAPIEAPNLGAVDEPARGTSLPISGGSNGNFSGDVAAVTQEGE